MIEDPYTALVLVGLIFLGLQLYVISSIARNNKNERFILNPTQLYAIKLRVEKLFASIHTRKD